MQQNEDYVIELLQDAGLLTRTQIAHARDHLSGNPSVLDALVQEGVISAVDVSRNLAAQAQMDWIDLSTVLIPPEVTGQLRPEDARRFKAIPIAVSEHGLVVAISDPLDMDAIDSLSFLLKCEVELVCTTPESARFDIACDSRKVATGQLSLTPGVLP